VKITRNIQRGKRKVKKRTLDCAERLVEYSQPATQTPGVVAFTEGPRLTCGGLNSSSRVELECLGRDVSNEGTALILKLAQVDARFDRPIRLKR